MFEIDTAFNIVMALCGSKALNFVQCAYVTGFVNERNGRHVVVKDPRQVLEDLQPFLVVEFLVQIIQELIHLRIGVTSPFRFRRVALGYHGYYRI